MERQPERHYSNRIGWLRASVLGANDGLVSTASLLVGVAAAQAERSDILLAGVAGIVAGAISMAAGEYVSVSSQADSEAADLERERSELENHYHHEHLELAGIYERRGLDAKLAKEVATQLMQHDALAAHARDELGITDIYGARPVQAAVASGLAFAAGAAPPLIVAATAPMQSLIAIEFGAALPFLATLGALAAWTGGAPLMKGSARVMIWGAFALGATAVVGRLFGHVL